MRVSALLTLAILVTPAAMGLADDKDAAMKKYVESLQGEWQMLTRVEDGTATAEDVVKKRTITFQDNKYTVRNGTEVFAEVTCTLELAKQPVELDIKFSDGDIHKGIIQLQDGTLSICLAEKKRPDRFESKPGDDRIMATYQRVKK